MKGPEKVKMDLVRQWLARAEEDFTLAQFLIAGETSFYGAIGFHTQQAVEKFIKAFLTRQAIAFSKTHDIDELLDRVAEKDKELSDSLRGSIILTKYGVDFRYPGDLPELGKEEAGAAVELAAGVRVAVLDSLDDYLTPRNPT